MESRFNLMIKNKRIYYLLFLVVLFYAVFLFFTDFNKIIFALKEIKLIYLLLAFLFTATAFSFVFFRWNYFLKKIDIIIPFKTNIKIFFTSWAMFFIPAKSGELIKCFFLKRLYQIPYKQSAPIIFMEQLLDLVVIFLFSLTGIGLFEIFPSDKILVILLVAFFLISLLLALLSFKKLVLKFLKISKRIRILQVNKKVEDFEQMYLAAHSFFKPSILLASLLYSLGIWFFLSLVLQTLLYTFDIYLPMLISLSVFSLASLIGVLSFIPSGIGTMEISAFIFLTNQGIPQPIAVICLILVRFFTLWLGVITGLFSFWSLNRKMTSP